MKIYKYTIVGAGISGCSTAYELSKHSKDILLIDKLNSVAQGASKAAGAFLSPLLGKPNYFKSLVTQALKHTTTLYKTNFSNAISNCGTLRIPKNDIDREKFKSYEPYHDFTYTKEDDGFFFSIGSVVSSQAICKMMTTSFINDKNKIDTKFNYNVVKIEYKDNLWVINDEIKTEHLILSTGASINYLDEPYLKIRPVWGRRIDISTSTKLNHNYHKNCSVSKSFEISSDKYQVSIGATHHRDYQDIKNSQKDIEDLLNKAASIIELKDIEILKEYIGARACSVDYIPLLGEVINSKQTIEDFPYLKHGTYVQESRFTRYKNLYILNGVGGRGFVLAPYLAKILTDFIINKKEIDTKLLTNRLFLRYIKKTK